MGRLSRIEVKGLVYYISSEGEKRQKIFLNDADRHQFINILRQQKIKGNLNFYAYILLPNQYALLFKTYSNNLSKSMHRINSDYANYFNRRYNRKNKLFKDRYKCFIVEKNEHLEEVSSYLHLQPHNTKVTKSLFQYKWSSLPGYVQMEKREDWIDYDYLLLLFNEKIEKACIEYKNYIHDNSKKQITSPFIRLKRSIILGSENFKKSVYRKQHLEETASLKDEEALAQKIIELVTQSRYWSSLAYKKRRLYLTTLSRNASINYLKKYTDLSNQQIKSYFKSLKLSSISQMSRRFNLTRKRNETINKISEHLEEKIKQEILLENNNQAYRTD